MKLATFVRKDGSPAVGVVDTERGQILDLALAARQSGMPERHFASMLALIDAGSDGLAEARRLAKTWPAAYVSLKGAKLLAPLPEPRQMRDCMVFEEHVANAYKRASERTGRPLAPIPQVWYDQPIYYKANRFAVCGPDIDVTWPRYSQVMDFELEMACVIGKRGKDIQPDHAHEHIFGFTIFNDLSARDAQMVEMAAMLGPAKGKDFDNANVLGPWIVTPDEIGDPHALTMEARVNGERWGGGTSAAMHHRWPAILAHVSKGETIYAGEVICSGTVGTGCGLELGRQLQDGDVVELEIEKIGVLKTRVLRPK
ncbi:MAG TPA: fumarylacetoacetate hydrolase family protein [Beijerinckiaceae bacterium]|nr:fumarylacetoacetate hydrolase family protein [Beijerinckiaceae bacterium]